MTIARKLVFAAAIAASVAGGGAVALKSLGSETVAGEDPRQGPPLVQVASVKVPASFERAFTGLVSARVQSNLGFRVAGKVVERLVDVGQSVHAGEPLMRIDPKDLTLSLESKDNAVAAAHALAVQAVADEARYRTLVASGWATRQRYEQAKAVLDNANAQTAAAAADASVARNEAGYSMLLADADGVVVETLAEPGQVVTIGQTVVKLAHAGAREATVNLPETLRPAVGFEAQAALYGASTGRSAARLRQLSDSADPVTRTYEARFVLEGEAASAPLGATVTLWVGNADKGRIAEVPLAALRDDGLSTGVWVLDPATSTVSLRQVTVRRIGEELATVIGVESGEQVVAMGAHMLNSGERVRFVGQRSAAR